MGSRSPEKSLPGQNPINRLPGEGLQFQVDLDGRSILKPKSRDEHGDHISRRKQTRFKTLILAITLKIWDEECKFPAPGQVMSRWWCCRTRSEDARLRISPWSSPRGWRQSNPTSSRQASVRSLARNKRASA